MLLALSHIPIRMAQEFKFFIASVSASLAIEDEFENLISLQLFIWDGYENSLFLVVLNQNNEFSATVKLIELNDLCNLLYVQHFFKLRS